MIMAVFPAKPGSGYTSAQTQRCLRQTCGHPGKELPPPTLSEHVPLNRPGFLLLEGLLRHGEGFGIVPGKLLGAKALLLNSRAIVCVKRQMIGFKLSEGTAEHLEALALPGAEGFDPSGEHWPFRDWVAIPIVASEPARSLPGVGHRALCRARRLATRFRAYRRGHARSPVPASSSSGKANVHRSRRFDQPKSGPLRRFRSGQPKSRPLNVGSGMKRQVGERWATAIALRWLSHSSYLDGDHG